MRNEILTHYQSIAAQISEQYSYQDVPIEVQHYFLLAELIGGASMEIFANRYGLLPISQQFAANGKAMYLNRQARLTDFEMQVCDMWYIFTQSNSESQMLC